MGDNYYVLTPISYYFFANTLLRALRGIRSFAHAILFICKQYFKMCGISIPYTCQETSANFYLLFITNPLPGNFYVYLQC